MNLFNGRLARRAPNRTLDAYAASAAVYAQRTAGVDMSRERDFFLQRLPQRAGAHKVIDAGCGSARDALEFRRLGLEVVAFDGCKEMADIASGTCGQEVQHLQFDQVEWVDSFDGVWACASLLHLDDVALQDALNRLARSLTPGGVLCAVMKQGEGTSTAADGRFFNYVTLERISKLLERAGLGQIESFEADSYMSIPDTTWLTVAARKPYF
jgi:SAM-dependent methyltransferase